MNCPALLALVGKGEVRARVRPPLLEANLVIICGYRRRLSTPLVSAEQPRPDSECWRHTTTRSRSRWSETCQEWCRPRAECPFPPLERLLLPAPVPRREFLPPVYP